MLPLVLRRLSTPGRTVACYYCHTRHRFDHLDLEFEERLRGAGLRCEEVREPWREAPPPSPPPLTELFPELRVAVLRITIAAVEG